MNIEEAREYCLSLKNVTECFPLDVEEPTISVKCNPDYTEELRDRYKAVESAYHFNKKYWNGIFLERDMPDDEIRYWIQHSYREVIAKLPKKIREIYNE